MRPSAFGLLAATVAVLSLAAAGCGTTVVDAGKGEKAIKKEIESATGQTGVKVSCPSGRETKAGDRFTCDATGADGSKAKVNVVQRDDKGNVRFTAPLLHTNEAEQLLTSKVAQGGAAVKVDCPDLIALKAGKRFSCKAMSGSERATIDATATDAAGNFSYKVRTG